MDKLSRFANEEEIRKSKEEFIVHAEMKKFFEYSKIEPSKHLMDMAEAATHPDGFVDRLIEVEGKLRDRFFGLTYEIESTIMLRRDRSPEALMEALAIGEKYFSKEKVIHEQIDGYGFLKLALEKDTPLFDYEDYLFSCVGIKRDHSGISLSQKNAISVQSAAQVFWYLRKSKIPNIAEMKKELMDKKNPLYELLKMNQYSIGEDAQTIDKWISKIFPVPEDLRKGRPSKKGIAPSLFDNLIPIPEVFPENGAKINFLKLRFTLECLTRVLKALDWQLEQIIGSQFINLYTRPLGFEFYVFSKSIIENWVREAFAKNSCIFS